METRIENSYTHFAVNKSSGKIIDGWDYAGYGAEDLRGDMRYYFWEDLMGYLDLTIGEVRKNYKILTRQFLEKHGYDVEDGSNWANR